MARGLSYEITAVHADRVAAAYGDVGEAVEHAEPAFEEIVGMLEAEEARHFRLMRGRYVLTGQTEASLTQPDARDAIRRVHGDSLVFGTSVYYARFLAKSRRDRENFQIEDRKGRSAVLVLRPVAVRRAAQVLVDHCARPFQ